MIEEPPWDSHVLQSHNSIFANNSFHWLSPECKEIKCFDLSTHKFYEMPQLPDNILRDAPKLGVLQGKVCLVTICMDIWILEEYNNKASWTQLFRNIMRPSAGCPCDAYQLWKLNMNIGCLKDGSNIFIAFTKRHTRDPKLPCLRVVKGLKCCEMESGATNKIIHTPDLPDDLLLASKQPWVESLVDPLALSLTKP
uniref:F-box associated domain-containing protein n=1 Tax=Chenopodium quinoa TaxID=63459 RepID=A0A803LQ76_CHEQI